MFSFIKKISLMDNPWGNGGNQEPPKRPNANKNNDPDLELLLKKYKGKFDDMKPDFGTSKGIFLGFLVFVCLWLLTGLYTVGPDEQGLILRFGKYDRSAGPGLHYHLPKPIEKLRKVKVTKINSVEIGYRSYGRNNWQRLEESLMLTGDENIVDINFEVQWRVKDAYHYLFNFRDLRAGNTVKSAAESAMREVIGKTEIALALAEGRDQIEQESRNLLQEMLDSYQTGIEIVRLQLLKVDPPSQVIDAFRDVQTAKLDKEKTINQAESYQNDIIPKARGEAQALLEGASAYKESVIAGAKGDAERFSKVYYEYIKSPDVTRRRMYIQTMEEVLSKAQVTIVDGKASKTGVMPYLPMKEFKTK